MTDANSKVEIRFLFLGASKDSRREGVSEKCNQTVKLPSLTRTAENDLYEVIGPLASADKHAQMEKTIGFMVLKGGKEILRGYFAACASDILDREAALALAMRLKNFPGNDSLSADTQCNGEVLEDSINRLPNTTTFLLGRTPESSCVNFVVGLEKDQFVVNRSGGRLLYAPKTLAHA